MERKITKQVQIGTVKIGNGNPIAVQSMLNQDTHDAKACLRQLHELAGAGCQIARLAVYDEECLEPLRRIVKESPLPLVADIHFDDTLALASIDAGISKIRINPGNIGSDDKIRQVAEAAKQAGIPIRVGANSGSIHREFLDKYGRSSAALAESALQNVRILERHGFEDIVISVKSSSVEEMVQANEYISQRCDYPLHLGVTEAGDRLSGTVKSSAGIGALLLKGIGDTIRVSLTAPPVEEVQVGLELLRAVGTYEGGVEIISCPTCARCKYELFDIAEKLRARFAGETRSLKLAVMGCVVNGPGEAKHADLGIAGNGNGSVVLFAKGEKIEMVPEEQAVEAVYRRAQALLEEKSRKYDAETE